MQFDDVIRGRRSIRRRTFTGLAEIIVAAATAMVLAEFSALVDRAELQ